ncbi:MAG: M23 family metallopeptidase [Verrucomicrobiales bacterium]|nr:M23 family metallopeptidase [Verrucomicrobiales bacterium]
MRPAILILAPLIASLLTSGFAQTTSKAPEDEKAVWPISRSREPDTNLVVFPFGPRNIGRYDFHGGIDIYVKRGTPVGSILAGRVLYMNKSTVLVQHSDQRKTAYLHLDSVEVSKGDSVKAGDIIGTAGDINAKDVHLHLTYLVGPKRFIDEVESRNPLEILPHKTPPKPNVQFEGNSATVTLDPGLMTIRRITLACNDSTTLTLDYREIIKQGRKPRQNQNQSGIKIKASRPRRNEGNQRVFDLLLEPIDPEQNLRQVIIEDLNGVIISQTEK